VVCLEGVIVKRRRNEEAQAHIGLSSNRKKKPVAAIVQDAAPWFDISGINPFNFDVFPDHLYLPSAATDKEPGR
jgi:hypothetical protein